jgi:large conductance mechanosensitive channel
MKKLLNEFKDFIMRGNVMDMAVGVIVGGAFTAIVNSLMDDILNPIIGLFSVDGFEGLKVMIGGTALNYGNFISAILNFLIVAFVIFNIVKGLNRLSSLSHLHKEEEPEEEPAEPELTKEEELLTQILEELRAGKPEAAEKLASSVTKEETAK